MGFLELIPKIKTINEKSIVLNFTKYVYVYDNPKKKSTQSSKKTKIKKHTIDMIPTNWRLYVIEDIYILKKKQVKSSQHFTNSLECLYI